MESERFEGLVRSFGQTRSRRQALRGLAGAGALLALLSAKPGEEATAGERPHERLHDRTPQRNRQQRNKNDNNKNNNNPDQNNGPDPGRLDADGDGLGAATERQLGTDLANPDTDGDGVTDGAEVDSGTDPLMDCEEQCSSFTVLSERCGLLCLTNPTCSENCRERCFETCLFA